MSDTSEREDFIAKVEVGLRDIEEGSTIPFEDVKKLIDEWRSKSNQRFDQQPL